MEARTKLSKKIHLALIVFSIFAAIVSYASDDDYFLTASLMVASFTILLIIERRRERNAR